MIQKLIQKLVRSPIARLFGAAAAAALLTAVAACKTTEGAGKDVENLGKDMQNSAEKHSP